MIEPFVDAIEGAKFLGIRPRRLLELARNGDLPGHPVGKGLRKVWRFKLSELEAAITKQNPDVGNQNPRYDRSGRFLAVPSKKGC